jgi:hypothetical protein
MNIQLAKLIYLKAMSTMKKTLDLVAYGTDKRTSHYKFAKSQIMDYTYENLRKLFKTLEDNKIIKKCSCETNLRKGYKQCLCGGSGYINNE